MDSRRLEQLDRARKLGATVSVQLGQGDEVPIVVELNSLKRESLDRAARVYVQVLSWMEVRRYVTIPAHRGAKGGLTDAGLADAVDRALDRFEQKG
jgi:hypothetical protein